MKNAWVNRKDVFNSSSGKKIYLIGDSHAASFALELKNKIDIKNYKFVTYLIGDCGFFPGFNLTELSSNKVDKNCNNSYFKKLEKELLRNKNAIIIFSSRLPLYLKNKEPDGINGKSEKIWNKAYVSENTNESLENSFKKSINALSKEKKIIFVYPIPEFNVHVPKKLFNLYIRGKIDLENLKSEEFITTTNKSYLERTNSSFQLLNSIKNKNVFRVYPNKVFCNNLIKGKCISHDKTKIYYFDSNHLSVEGSKIISDLIFNQINFISNQL